MYGQGFEELKRQNIAEIHFRELYTALGMMPVRNPAGV